MKNKWLFDLLPVILFFVAFRLADIYVATAVAIATSAAQIGWLLIRRRPIDTMQWVGLVIIVVFGGMTLLLHDESFIKWKPTILYWCFAAALSVASLLGKAPLGYRNVRSRDENGREVRTVALDEEHAPLIRLDFQEYVTGSWTVRTLADHLNNRDLTVPPTAHKPATPSQSSGCRSCCATPTTRALSPSRASSTRDSTSHWWTLPPGRRCKTSWRPTPTASGSACTLIISRAPSSAASAVPDGAFYVYFDVTGTGLDAWTFCERALEEAHVALTPGRDFGPATGRTHVRLSYAASREEIALGLERLGGFVDSLR